jgi:putative protease
LEKLMTREGRIRLNAPAGNLPALKAAVDAGADSVYIGFRSPTNLRNLPGLNLTVADAAEGVEYAHCRGVRVHVAVNTHPLDGQLPACFQAADDAVEVGADAVIATDWAVLDYVRGRHPRLELHLSCVAGAADAAAIQFYRQAFGVSRVILPRVLSLQQIAALRQQTDVALEVLAFGVLCANYEGRCYLSSFLTGESANSMGACAPAEFVKFEETGDGGLRVRLNGVVINHFVGAELRTYPTPCKGKFHNTATNREQPAFQEPCFLNALPLLPGLAGIGVDALKIEGRQRSLAYVRLVTGIWREAIDSLAEPQSLDRQDEMTRQLESLMEGQACTSGGLRGGPRIENICRSGAVALGSG